MTTLFGKKEKERSLKAKASPYNGFHCMIIDLKVGIPFTKRGE
jgi:hypothetical protein